VPPDVIHRVIEARITLRIGSRRLARAIDLPRSTIDAILRRHGLSRLGDLEHAPEVPVSYSRERPGQVLHLHSIKLERIPDAQGPSVLARRRQPPAEPAYDVVHFALDDATRVAFVRVRDDDSGRTSAAFLAEAVGWLAGHAVRVRQVSTIDTPNYAGDRDFVDVVRSIGASHVQARSEQQASGRAERFTQTVLNEWAYAQSYLDNKARLEALGPWVDYYNYDRPHPQLGGQTPMRVLIGNVTRDPS
jgi:transposase InsO family protein